MLVPDKYFDIYFDECIVPYIRKNHKALFSHIEENLCLEHYNLIHKTNFAENKLKLNASNCWLCKQIKDRP